jgi:hypothetical protein
MQLNFISKTFQLTYFFFLFHNNSSCTPAGSKKEPVSAVNEIVEETEEKKLNQNTASTGNSSYAVLKNTKPTDGREDCPYVMVAKNDTGFVSLKSPENPELGIATIYAGSVLLHKGSMGNNIQVYFEDIKKKTFLSGILDTSELFCVVPKELSQNSTKKTQSNNDTLQPKQAPPAKVTLLKCKVEPAYFWPEESCFSTSEKNAIRNNRVVKKIKRDKLVCASQAVYQEGSGVFFNYKARVVDDGTGFKCLVETKRLACTEYCR